MKNKIYVNEDETARIQEIRVPFTRKGGEKGKQSIEKLINLIQKLSEQPTPEKVEELYDQIIGYCLCCVDNEFIDKAGADELMAVVALLVAIEEERARREKAE